MNISEKSNIGKIVAENYRFATVFKTAGIDFCCNGNRTIAEACEEMKIDTQNLLDKLTQAAGNTVDSNVDYRTWPLDLLADYIEKTHHRYVEQKAAEITPYLEKVARVHGGNHPELIEIERLFHESVQELTAHMKKEELMLFPFIRNMVKAQLNGEPLPKSLFGEVKNPIASMMAEHDNEGERFRQISALSDDYTPPADGCNTYRVTFALLKEFEEDLHKHIHLENNILFPAAIELEKKLS